MALFGVAYACFSASFNDLIFIVCVCLEEHVLLLGLLWHFVCFRYMMCSNAEDLYEMANWVGKGAESRQKLIEKLQGSYFIL